MAVTEQIPGPPIRNMKHNLEPLQLFAVFHLNLAYSSIEEGQRSEVIRRCYWPMLKLAAEHRIPIGIEASGYTLEVIATLDRTWIEELKRLIATGLCEFLGSGYVQLIGPLVPAAVNDANLRIGNTIYQDLLGFKPTLAYINEQAYSSGLVQHYLAHGYRAMLMEWDNPASLHPHWPSKWRYLPQYAVDQQGREIPLIWSSSIAFQSLQRYVHGELGEDAYLEQLERHRDIAPRAFCLYANDAEIFDYRPGRYHTEPAYDPTQSEWTRLAALFRRMARREDFYFVLPCAVLRMLGSQDAGYRLNLPSAAQPAVVKKQPKYNLVRWAVTGRNDVDINSRCRRLAAALQGCKDEALWKRLCYLLSSDFRTHITESRWAAYLADLTAMEAELGVSAPAHVAIQLENTVEQGWDFATSVLRLRLNTRRGLAIDGLWLRGQEQPLLGTLPHGLYDDIEFAADWYSGHLVYEPAGQHKITDLEPIEALRYADSQNGEIVVEGVVDTALASVTKRFRLAADKPVVKLSYTLKFHGPPFGSLRMGFITLHPGAWDRASLYYANHNGGWELERYPLGDVPVEQHLPVSSLVSARGGLGLTEGILVVGDKDKALRITIDPQGTQPLGLLQYQTLSTSFFLRVGFSLSETDDTRRVGDVPPAACLALGLELIR